MEALWIRVTRFLGPVILKLLLSAVCGSLYRYLRKIFLPNYTQAHTYDLPVSGFIVITKLYTGKIVLTIYCITYCKRRIENILVKRLQNFYMFWQSKSFWGDLGGKSFWNFFQHTARPYMPKNARPWGGESTVEKCETMW